jgi:hypothetical protein
LNFRVLASARDPWHHGGMPRRTSKLDDAQNALRVVEQAIGGPLVEKPSRSLVSQVMAEMGRKGGKIGGKRRLETMTPEKRSQIALKAARSRWSKRKKT